ncbi:MAG: hypothetical protein KKD44_25045 [Proteobacteria bacterium]|nr:hypothetical protein [Pseudomonadota bacterium]
MKKKRLNSLTTHSLWSFKNTKSTKKGKRLSLPGPPNMNFGMSQMVAVEMQARARSIVLLLEFCERVVSKKVLRPLASRRGLFTTPSRLGFTISRDTDRQFNESFDFLYELPGI